MKTTKGEKLRDAGIAQAMETADNCNENWSQKAFDFLRNFAKKEPSFLTEEVRRAATKSGEVPEPPSNRAWGGVIVRAKRAGIIKSLGIKPVTNPKAHMAFATYWGSLICA
ncbi:hypothetical protein MG296_10720 [Flavobacteriaceae bacterium TK19130]|nr:hypothetical protein [Thermobacterium salinum]